MNNTFDPKKIDVLLQLAINEDIGTGDITTANLLPDGLAATGVFLAKGNGVVAGLPVVEYFFSRLDTSVLINRVVAEGGCVRAGDIIATISGRARTLLSGERIALNYLQRLSGIATITAQFVEKIKPLKTAILDTRKTTPGWRYLEKYAVVTGGGVNHRMGLYDQVLVKDNHLDIMKDRPDSNAPRSASVIESVVSTLRKKVSKGVLIEVETRTLDEVRDALKSGADIILFDNMDVARLKEAVFLVKGWKGIQKPLTEASGNISLENVRQVAETGVDRISIGAITHSARALDVSLEINLTKNV